MLLNFSLKLSLALAVLGATGAAPAQELTPGEHEQYVAAAKQQHMDERLRALADFAAKAETSSLKREALELLVWNYSQLGDEQHASEFSKKLLAADPENALAIAAALEAARRSSPPTAPSDDTQKLAQQGLRSVARLEDPETMVASEFSRLRDQVLGILNGALGYDYFLRGDYVNARTSLRQAVQADPGDEQYAYALALADLDGRPPEASEGYWYLAKAVNLTQGTPAGRQIAQYAFNHYRRDGGTDENWSKFLAATAPIYATGPATTGTTVAATTPPTSVTVATSPPEKTTIAAAQTPQQMPQSDKGTISATKPAAAPAPVESSRKHEKEAPPPLPPVETAAVTAPPPIITERPAPAPTEPVSLGILIETAIASKENRSPVVYSLVDLARHLRNNDEAFVLSFGRQLEFEQDLTANYDLLDDAMEHIRPQPGAALLNAVAFSAGHLDRIAKNKNRVLLVISDGRNTGEDSSSYQAMGEILGSGARVFCIGLGVDDAADRIRLESLASRTGGRAEFISGTEQFRAAAHQIASELGIKFPM